MRKVKYMDKLLFFVTIIMSLYGLFNIVTASSREAVTNLDKSIFYYFYRHLFVLLIGFVFSVIILKINLRKYNKILPILFIFVLILNLWLVLK